MQPDTVLIVPVIISLNIENTPWKVTKFSNTALVFFLTSVFTGKLHQIVNEINYTTFYIAAFLLAGRHVTVIYVDVESCVF